MTLKLPSNINDPSCQRTIESECIEYKASWSSENTIHTINDFVNDDWCDGKNWRPQLSRARSEIATYGKLCSRLQKCRLTNLGKNALAHNKEQRL